MDPKQLALLLLQKNTQIANSPMGHQFLQILQSGDEQAGIQMAQNICASKGVTPQKALEMAKNQFHI